jgi:hypothetical protein
VAIAKFGEISSETGGEAYCGSANGPRFVSAAGGSLVSPRS